MLHAITTACRVLWRRPAFAATAVVTLGLAAAANATILAVVYGILLKPLPYQNPDRLVAVWPGRFQSNADLLYLRDHAAMFSDLAAVAPGWTMALTGSGDPAKLTVARVSGNLFETLGVQPSLGRALRASDARTGSDAVIVLTHQLWKQKFAGDAGIVGRSIRLDRQSFQVVGVLPPSFEVFNLRTDAFTPFALDPSAWYHRLSFSLFVARLAPGRSLEQADRDYRALIPEIRRARGYPNQYGETAHLQSLHGAVVGDTRSALMVVVAAVAVMLLVAAANVGILLLTRVAARGRELAIRTALGASRARVALELVFEGVTVALAGGVIGTLIAWIALPAVVRLLPRDIPRTAEIAVDWPVAAAVLVAAALSGLLFALAPALTSARIKTAALIRTGAHSESRRSKRLRGLLAAGEIGMALVLATGAGLLIQSLWRLQRIDPGFDPARVLTLHLQPANVGGRDERPTAVFYDTIIDKLRSLPGVVSAGAIQHLPFSGYSWNAAVDIEGHPVPEGGQQPTVGLRIVTPGYFASVGQPLLAGRDLERQDAGRDSVVIVNQALAKTYFGGVGHALGRTIRIRGAGIQSAWMSVVGVVGDVRHTSLMAPVVPEIYTSVSARSIPAMMIAVRAVGPPLAHGPAIREAIWSLEPNVPISDVQTMEAKIGESLARPRLLVSVLGGFAAGSLVLVLVGVYGVIAYSTAQRRREMAIMMALGAGRSRIVRVVLAEGLLYASLGVAVGVPAALAASRLLRTVLYGIAPTDPTTYAALAVTVTGVVLAASLEPALRVSRLDPSRALNQD
jgi:putative ABC transport system permease protein